MEKRESVKSQATRITSLYQIMQSLVPRLEKARMANKKNEAKSLEIQIRSLRKNIIHKLRYLHDKVCSEVFEVTYLFDGKVNSAVLTNIKEDEIPLVLKLHFGLTYPKVVILEIKKIPTFIRR